MEGKLPRPSMRPIPIVFNSEREEEEFEKWAFSGDPRPIDIENMKGVERVRRMRQDIENKLKK